ncbi:hypothetical protein ETB97_008567 [Aspergillus alliaceus]|uniref:Uncharacterized protein n=1 Tax=Petromyces alliaceus TaxID=209559 RepID=A0A8H5ZSW9_PETAA|nr:hypothetical protein ETB97_008567 [Aspergillus burnettii]
MSAGGSLFGRASLGMTDSSHASPLMDPFVPLPEQNCLWAFSGFMTYRQGVLNNNLDMEQFQSSKVRNGQLNPPQYVNSMEKMYYLTQYSLTNTPSELASQKHGRRLSDQPRSQPDTYSFGPRCRRAPVKGSNQPERNEKRKKLQE